MRLIDADDAEKQFTAQYCESCNSYNYVKCRACEARDGADVYADMPTIDPVRHGHWIYATSDMSEKEIVDAIQDFIDHGGDPRMWRIDTYYCSGCLTDYHIYDDGFIIDGKGYYCPNCGAKLDSNTTD